MTLSTSRFILLAASLVSGALTSPAVAQGPVGRPARSAAAATGLTALGATAGAIVGGLGGAIVGATTASGAPPCKTGDPDGCLGAQLPRAIWGTGIGITVGTPIGAHLGNGRRGNAVYTALASTALFAGEIIALRSLVDDGRTRHKSTVIGIAIAVPILQIVATTIAERAFP
jgi:hypothetical protein